MKQVISVALCVGAFLAIDAVVPRPSWAPAPLVTREALIAAVTPAKPEPTTPEPTEDEAAPVTAMVQADFEPITEVPPTPPAPLAPEEPAATPVPVPIVVEPPKPARTERLIATSGKPFIASPEAGWDELRARLDELASGKRNKVRVVHLGDSEIAGDDVTRTLRKQFGKRYGRGGLGFVLAFRPWNWYAREGYDIDDPDGWSVHGFVQGKASDGDYGPGGFAFDTSKKGVDATVKLTSSPEGACRVGLHYEKRPEGGGLEILADGEKVETIETAADARVPTVWHHEFPECPEKLSARTTSTSKVRLFGWSVESSKPGIVWSSLGVVAATATHLQHYAPDQLAAALKTLEPDLIVLGYGLNIVHVPTPPPSSERTAFQQVMKDLRGSMPTARCLAVSPYPIALTVDGALIPSPSLPTLTKYQRQAAAEADCAFLDREELVGGPQTALKWLDAKPRILSGDYTHLTSIGAEKVGLEMARVLLNEKPETL